MHKLGLSLMVIMTVSLGTANGQVAEELLNFPQVEEVKDCGFVEVREYLPFELKAIYARSTDHLMQVKYDRQQHPNYTPVILQNDQISVFKVQNVTGSYTVTFNVNYGGDVKRAIYFEYWSQGVPVHTEIINYKESSFCRTFFITTSHAPEIPTVEEIGDYTLTNLIGAIADSINSNTRSVNSAIVFLVFAFLITIVLGFAQIVVYMQRRGGDRKKSREINDAIKHANLASANSAKVLTHVRDMAEKIVIEMNNKIDAGLNNFTVTANSILVDVKNTVENNRSMIQKMLEGRTDIKIDDLVKNEQEEQEPEPEEIIPLPEPKTLKDKMSSVFKKFKKDIDDLDDQEIPSEKAYSEDEIKEYEEQTGMPWSIPTTQDLQVLYMNMTMDELHKEYTALYNVEGKTEMETEKLNLIFNELKNREAKRMKQEAEENEENQQ